MIGFFPIRRFRTRLLLIILGLLITALTSSFLLVSRANRANAIAHIEENLNNAMRVFWFSVELRQKRLAQSAQVLSADWPLKALYLQDELDRPTLESTLRSYADRLQVPLVATFDIDGELLGTTKDSLTNDRSEPFRTLITKADEDATDFATDFAYLEDRLHVLVVVPLFAPRPNIIGWLTFAFPIDDTFARGLKRSTQADVTFIGGAGDMASSLPYAIPTDETFAREVKQHIQADVTFIGGTDQKNTSRVLASTLPSEIAHYVAQQSGTAATTVSRTDIMTLQEEPYVTMIVPLGILGDDSAHIALQRSLTAELVPARELENVILLISIAALMLATIIASAAAKGVSRPIQELTEHTKQIAQGNYKTRLQLNRHDELGQLAEAFNDMSAGLAERDQVRDLLDKNVSPEVAAQLMRDGAALGGEEREVTILFADLRGFTPLSEKLSPPEMVELLNRYLDRMSTEIERHGGVIDKFIGDAIMAVFGAPVRQPDDADRALQSALAMEKALAALNRELADEGSPPLSIGIGINTAFVVAGNIGSQRRLNYSVIGDGVNVAARLETLTRQPEYNTTILASAATIDAASQNYHTRPLGSVSVKGRQEPVTIFALGPPLK